VIGFIDSWLLIDMVTVHVGCVIVQTISLRLRTTAAGFNPRQDMCDCGGQSVTWAAFPRVLWLPSQSFHRLLHTYPSSGADAIGQTMADLASRLNLAPSREIN
jgi:hypothetical protein